MSHQPKPSPVPPTPDDYDEADRPLREVFALRLPAAARGDLERRARDACTESSADGGLRSRPEESDVRLELKAAARDLRETARFLAAVAREHQESELPPRDLVLSMLAGPRSLEVEAIAERIEAMLAFEPTPARVFPADVASAALVPSRSADAPLRFRRPAESAPGRGEEWPP